ncbi:hypothetical protein A9200_10830 [Maribacter hydrothermalis]|uniref:Uncharacterized protein n=2 Tax=Maribacter hydrothermalis TaxID=1836467 RepID=A0A1B7YYZ7_9FLAO|nr:hypothetical protein BTR34_01685 [Maribacter hydrothermalis]OBR35687.1 hypothetical protein A9200_10830 [Maribacter hydrothermalis]
MYITNAQEFQLTDKYDVTNQRSSGQQEEDIWLVDVIVTNNPESHVATLSISDFGLLDEIRISVLSNPDLEDINEILKVTVEYNACCSSTEEYYYLVSNDNDFISLPGIKNEYAYEPITDIHYIFPNQLFGKEGTILRAALQYTETATIKEIKVLRSIAWNDDDFDTEDAITAIN